MQVQADDAHAAGDNPTRITLSTTADGASSPTERLRIDSSGNVGIGTTSPDEKLDINVSSTLGFSIGDDPADSTKLALRSYQGSTNNNVRSISYIGSDHRFQVGAVTGTTASEVLRIDSSGRLGVGTSSPSSLFHVKTGTNGNVQIQPDGSSQYAANIINTGGNIRLGTTTNTNADVIISSMRHVRFGDENDNEFVRIDSSGNVGIGTTSPDTLVNLEGGVLRVSGTRTAGSFLDITPSNTGTDGINFGASYYGAGNYGPLKFTTGGSERVRIDSSGRLLVGTTSARTNVFAAFAPAQQIEGTTANTSRQSITRNSNSAGSEPAFIFGKSRGTSNGSNTVVSSGDRLGALEFSGADGTVLRPAAHIRAEVDGTPGDADMPGRLILGTTADGASSPTERMRINRDGVIYATGIYSSTVNTPNRDVYVSSDGKLGYLSSIRESKTNITPIDTVDWLYQLAPVTFNYRTKDEAGTYTDEFSNETEYGLIAEDVQAVAPDLCFYDEVDGNQELRGVSYQKLITPLLVALQQANQRIEQLETKVAALEAQ